MIRSVGWPVVEMVGRQTEIGGVMFGALGMPELAIILVICIIIFGPRQLPKLGRMFGDTVRELRGVGKELDDLHDGK